MPPPSFAKHTARDCVVRVVKRLPRAAASAHRAHAPPRSAFFAPPGARAHRVRRPGCYLLPSQTPSAGTYPTLGPMQHAARDARRLCWPQYALGRTCRPRLGSTALLNRRPQPHAPDTAAQARRARRSIGSLELNSNLTRRVQRPPPVPIQYMPTYRGDCLRSTRRMRTSGATRACPARCSALSEQTFAVKRGPRFPVPV